MGGACRGASPSRSSAWSRSRCSGSRSSGSPRPSDRRMTKLSHQTDAVDPSPRRSVRSNHNRRRALTRGTGGRGASAARPFSFPGPGTGALDQGGSGMRKSNDIRKDLLRSLARPEVTLERMESRDGSIVSHWRIRGRNVRGVPTLGIQATGEQLDVALVTVDSVVDGVAHSRTMIDVSSVMAQVDDPVEVPAAG